jgi:hypothetical protein
MGARIALIRASPRGMGARIPLVRARHPGMGTRIPLIGVAPCETSVHIAPIRAPPRGPRGPPGGEATLAFSATKVTLLPPQRVFGGGMALDVVVHVRKIDPPEGVEAV